METSLVNQIEECFAEFEYYWSLKAYYVALCILGEVVDASPHLPKSVRMASIQRLKKIRIPSAIAYLIRIDLLNDRDYVLRMLSISDSLVYEEILLILVKRRELENVKRILEEYGSYQVNLDLQEIDDFINHVLKSPKLNDDFHLALESMKKNARLPFSDYEIT